MFFLISDLRRVFSKSGPPGPVRAEEISGSKMQKLALSFLSAFHAGHCRGQEAELPGGL